MNAHQRAVERGEYLRQNLPVPFRYLQLEAKAAIRAEQASVFARIQAGVARRRQQMMVAVTVKATPVQPSPAVHQSMAQPPQGFLARLRNRVISLVTLRRQPATA